MVFTIHSGCTIGVYRSLAAYLLGVFLSNDVQVIECYDLPEVVDASVVYRLLPNDFSVTGYAERTDRNIGWISRAEQNMLRDQTVAIAGCGGMGGLVAATMIRLGIGTVRIADPEVFDASNLNRQFAANLSTIGESKAIETARLIRGIARDTTVEVFPRGVAQENVKKFVADATVVCDEIEAFATDARILLHQHGRQEGTTIFNCNTVGFSTFLFRYVKNSMTVEEAFGLSYDEAVLLRQKNAEGDLSARKRLVDTLMRAVVPALPDYAPGQDLINTGAFYRRMYKEGRVPIIAPNPVMAAGFLCDHVLLEILTLFGCPRDVVRAPAMPGYLRFDAARMNTSVHTGVWW